MKTVGRIRELWRYPVKSMGGERIDASTLGLGGIAGDRSWAVRDEVADGSLVWRPMPGPRLEREWNVVLQGGRSGGADAGRGAGSDRPTGAGRGGGVHRRPELGLRRPAVAVGDRTASATSVTYKIPRARSRTASCESPRRRNAQMIRP